MGRQLIVTAVVVCACGAATTAPTTTTAPSARVSVSVVASVETARAFRELPPVSMHVVAKAKTTRLPFANSSGATFAGDGATYFVDAVSSGKPGGFIVSSAHPQGVFFGVSEVHDARFSDDAKSLAILNDETDAALVATVPDGMLASTVTHAKVVRWDGKTSALLAWDGCQLTREGAPVGPKTCGGADASEDGRTWVVVSPESHGRPLSMRSYDRLTWIDSRTGAAKTIFEKHEGERGIGEIRLSPNGDFVCFLDGVRRFRCVSLRGDRAEPVRDLPNLDAFRLSWDDRGGRFVAAPFRFDDLVVVDLDARTIRHLELREDIRWVGMFSGGKRLVAYEHGAWAIDTETGAAVEIFPKTIEAGGFVPVPNRDDRLMMGIESGATRDFVTVDLPAR